jgi:hypothetical protein
MQKKIKVDMFKLSISKIICLLKKGLINLINAVDINSKK